jgi:succinoglycan biosynthesis transport protein ExoP
MNGGVDEGGVETSRGEAVDLRRLGRLVWGRRRWIVIPTLACAAAALVAVTTISPRYTGVAKVLLENQESYFTRPDKAVGSEPSANFDPEGVQSQAETVTTTELARKAVDQLQLAQRVEFNPPEPTNPVAIVWSLLTGGRAGRPEDRLMDAFLARLTVFPIAKSRVLQIEFSSKDPALAARGANTVAALFLDAQQQAKRNEAKAASTWLSIKIDELRGKVAEADSKAEAFRASSGLLAGANGMTVPSQQLADMTTQLATARSTQASAAAKAQSLRTMLHDGRLDEIPQVTRDDSLRRYVEQRVALMAQISQESRTLLPEHPRMKELAGELAGLDIEIRSEANKTVAALESDAKLAAADVDSLSASLARQAKTVANGNADDVRLRALQLDAKTAGDQLESYLQKYREAVAREAENAAPADARIIASASDPREPTFPKKVPTIVLGTLAGFFISLGAVVAHVLLTDAVVVAAPHRGRVEDQAPEPVEPSETVSSVAVPQPAPPEEPPPEPPAIVAVADPPVAPAVSPPPAPRRVEDDGMISVATLADRLGRIAPKEGGALTALIAGEESGRAAGMALALGRRLAARGRAALVDLGDLPHPGEARFDGEEESGAYGLAELLDGRAGFAEALHRDRLSDLDVIPAGIGAVAVEPLGEALAALAANYDFLVMHAYDWRSPAALAARDGVAVLAIVTAPARLAAALAEARDAVAADEIVVVGLESGEAALAERVA